MTATEGALTASPQTRSVEPAPTRRVLGVDVLVLDRAGATQRIANAVNENRHTRFAFLNAHGANLASTDDSYTATLATFDVLADGFGLDIASTLLYGEGFPANLNGTDFAPYLLDALPGPLTVGLLGAQPGIAQTAADRLAARAPQHWFRVLGDGFFDKAREAEILAGLEAHPVDILLVALGNPRQERWIERNITAAHATIPIGVGALFDFIAGRVPRAPLAMQRMRMEWLFRLSLEPRRMWRRYVVGNPAFLLRVARQRLRNGRS